VTDLREKIDLRQFGSPDQVYPESNIDLSVQGVSEIFKKLHIRHLSEPGDVVQNFLYETEGDFNNTVMVSFKVSSRLEGKNYQVDLRTTDNNQTDPSKRVHH